MRYLIFILILSSCSPQQRLARLLKAHPELIKTDTLYIRDTIVVGSSKKDTVFRNVITKDTLIIRENNLTVKYFNDGKTVYLKGKCDTVTIVREVPFYVNSVKATPETFWQKAWSKTKDFLIILLLGAIIVLIILSRKSFK